MKQQIYIIGLNHRTAEIAIREQFALCKKDSAKYFLHYKIGIQEILILSTCNRVEILIIAEENDEIETLLLQKWANICKRPTDDLSNHTYFYKGEEAVQHLFSVAASLDSMILGEPQILGQLKEAYRNAVQNKTTGTILNRLCHKAFSVAKRVRTETDIASSAVSISYAAVELTKKIFSNLQNLRAMLIGAGEMAELAATHLLEAGVKHIFIANRTFATGKELATTLGGEAIHFENLTKYLSDIDIVISSTGANNTIITAADIQEIMKKRQDSPMFFIDIAVPRDIASDVGSLKNVYLYDIDDLKDVVQENMQIRQDEALQGKKIVDEETQKFFQWKQGLAIKPTIINLLEKAENLAYREIHKSSKNLLSCKNETEIQAVLEKLALSIARKICLEPIDFLKRKNENGQGQEATVLIHRIFNLSEDNITPHIHTHRK